VPVDDGQFGALIALVFNIGAGNLQASTLLRKLNAGDVAGAAEQFLAWDKARVDGVLKPLAGLTRRRRAERAMFLGEDWRAAAAPAGVSRSRAAPLEVLPVPEAPEPEPVPRAKKPAQKKPAAKKLRPRRPKKPLAKKPAATKAAAKKAAAKKTPVARA
jgi:lysozyme